MLKLIQNELIKIFTRPGTYVMIALLIIAASVTGAFMKYQENGKRAVDNSKWEQTLKTENSDLKRQYTVSTSNAEKEMLKRDITINDYRLAHHIPPEADYNLWSFVSDSSQLLSLVGLFMIIISAGIVASEFNWGTIKLLLIRPINRQKILASKYLAVLLFGFFMSAILFVFSALLGAILFGMPAKAFPFLNYYNGHVTEQNIVVHLVLYYFYHSISMIMLATMAFMISSVFRNSSLAIGISIFLMFTGTTLTSLLIALKFSWAKYLLFANTDLMQYIDGTPIADGMSLPFSVMMLIIYFLVFQFLAFFIFQKRDVAA